ncbi:patatin family protein [Vibrio sp. SS-MA-C1-2]|uniref:patatin-like phospholipase family protein n=1 Tax=Vibrio sp. SS-MA-C1-2 TaxID=2908646 RepID=UPI001F417398|nr:patatin family protein [Vibrio sp. SS-MA-C1-2]UJF18728.1 patatin family protein [Vibrio sp. SS-MA-C1-2]
MDKIGNRALIVEGGAMRGIFACGVLDHFLDNDFSPFDSFWGVSAGATNLAAYIAKMPRRNKKIFLDYSLRKEFITPTQFMRGRDLVNLDWMWQITIEELDIDRKTFSEDPRPLFLTVTRQDSGKPEYLTPNVDELAEVMKASSALPIFYRNGVQLEQHWYVDGGVSDAIPVAEAIRRGAKQIMVLRSRHQDYRKKSSPFSSIIKMLLKKQPELIEPMLTRHQRYNEAVELIAKPPQGVEIIQICPGDNFKLGRLSQDQKTLESAYQMGVEAGRVAISQWQLLTS